ncbi:hypothetical protein PORY_000139 [Pneumocystis oryctolagi]|uniref:Uncharacterized protein n=1 Tax=Pneumocystis oryctolagi TaxID=42067 RepID=A0ACB7CEC6_9ASCO|nr:hypothetical protein PORY_000139 [Pneumocystis oryctolagi]
MNKYKNGIILTVTIYKLRFKLPFLSIINGFFLFVPLTMVFFQNLKFFKKYLYSYTKNQECISKSNEKHLDDYEEEKKLQKIIKTKPELDAIKYEHKHQKRIISLKKPKKEILIDERYFLIRNLLPNKKQCLIKYSDTMQSCLLSFCETKPFLYTFYEPSVFEKNQLFLNIGIIKFLKSKKHNSLNISILYYVSNDKSKEFKKVRIFLKDIEKSSEDYINFFLKKIPKLYKNNQNINKLTRMFKPISTNQENYPFFYNNFDFNSKNLSKNAFKCQLTYDSTKDSAKGLIKDSTKDSTKNSTKTFPIIYNHNNSSKNNNSFLNCSYIPYKELPSTKKNVCHPLSDIQNSSLKISSTSLLYSPSFNTQKISFKGKSNDIHIHLKENISPTTQWNTEWTKENSSVQLISDISNTIENDITYVNSLTYEKKSTFFKENCGQGNRIYNSNYCLTDKTFFDPKTSLKTRDTEKPLKKIKQFPTDSVCSDAIFSLLNFSNTSLRISKYKHPKVFSPIKINNIYEDSLRLLRKVSEDNRRRGIPPVPLPIQKRWEFVES